jgi:hypothetical protein
VRERESRQRAAPTRDDDDDDRDGEDDWQSRRDRVHSARAPIV